MGDVLSTIKSNRWQGFPNLPQIRNKCRSIYVKYVGGKKAEDTVLLPKSLNTPVSGKSWTKIYVLHSPLKSISQAKSLF